MKRFLNLVLLSLVTAVLMTFAQERALAAEADAASAALVQRMDKVIMEELPTLKGKTAEAQFLSGLEQISEAYEQRWKEPLPVFVDVAALRELRNEEGRLSGLMGPSLKSVPLPEALRYCCVRAGMAAKIVDGRVLISVEQKAR